MGSMNCRFSSMRNAISRLERGEESTHGLHDLFFCTFGNQRSESATHRNWSHTSTFHLQGNERSPKEKGHTEEVVLPSRTRLIKAVRDLSRWEALLPAELQTIFLRCCGRRPSEPPAEPHGKDLTALTTSSKVTCKTLYSWSSGTSTHSRAGEGASPLRDPPRSHPWGHRQCLCPSLAPACPTH